jgi:hypothetical protein
MTIHDINVEQFRLWELLVSNEEKYNRQGALSRIITEGKFQVVYNADVFVFHNGYSLGNLSNQCHKMTSQCDPSTLMTCQGPEEDGYSLIYVNMGMDRALDDIKTVCRIAEFGYFDAVDIVEYSFKKLADELLKWQKE